MVSLQAKLVCIWATCLLLIVPFSTGQAITQNTCNNCCDSFANEYESITGQNNFVFPTSSCKEGCKPTYSPGQSCFFPEFCDVGYNFSQFAFATYECSNTVGGGGCTESEYDIFCVGSGNDAVVSQSLAPTLNPTSYPTINPTTPSTDSPTKAPTPKPESESSPTGNAEVDPVALFGGALGGTAVLLVLGFLFKSRYNKKKKRERPSRPAKPVYRAYNQEITPEMIASISQSTTTPHVSRVYSDPAANSPTLSLRGKPRTFIVAFDFEAESADELTVNEGTRVIGLRQISPEWWLVTPADPERNVTGLVPTDFMDEAFDVDPFPELFPDKNPIFGESDTQMTGDENSQLDAFPDLGQESAFSAPQFLDIEPGADNGSDFGIFKENEVTDDNVKDFI